MDSATLRQEVSQAAAEVSSTKQSLSFAVMEENNTEDKEKKGAIGNKIEQLKGNLEGAASRHSSAVSDLRTAEGMERKEKLAEETAKQKEEQANIEKQAEAAKKPEEKLEPESKDKKFTVAKKEGAIIGGESYDRTGAIPKDPAEVQAQLLKQIQELAKNASVEVKEPHADEVKDKPAVVANVAAAPAIANTAATGVTQDSSAPTAASKIQGAAGSSGAST